MQWSGDSDNAGYVLREGERTSCPESDVRSVNPLALVDL